MEASTSPDAFAPSVAAKAPETVDGQGPIARDRKPEELVEGNSERDEGYLRRKERSSEAEAFEEEAGNHIVVVVLEIGTSEIRIGFSGDKTPRHRLPAFLSRLVEAGPQPEDLHSPLSLAKTFVGEDAFTAATRAAEEDGCAVGVVAAHPHHPWAVSRESYDNLFVVIDAALERLLEERPQGTEASAREKDDAVGESRDKATSSLPTAEMPWALLAVVPVICDQRLASCLLRWALETRREIFGAVKLIADARMAAYHHLLLLPEDQRSAEKGLLVVDAGETAIRVVPVGGQALTPGTHALQQTEVAGSLLTSLVLLHQEKRGEGTRGTRRGMTWREATQYKEQCCFVSGLVRQPSTDTFLFPEIFFTPQLLRNANLSPIVNSTSQASLTQVILDAFGKGTVCERALWLSRICLVGGTAKLANFATRIRLLVSDDPQLAAFCGASAFGRVAVLDEEAWITREEYEDSAAIPALGRRALRHANLG
ncbi:putative actin-like family protein [Neospora caninum Liverpool]|uniref:Putative actin-like family protein n=1 Tax=Neospora caninum (strain Liverpool) TaxID=572307 RepID=F0VJM3_NEOCL|nr:putative actin-like family protein [Neospora caninum Liverpool]CBZ53934.1 putative actin-like family protein [Neospora caninum Liverpool]|eukprot:XP_003883966.1 putative actin-like family protein [Neospora caninum Liverpool]